ncbi:MAG: PIN domain-containing protein [Dehalococcoidia bacterium]|nr:PIN domain-containing protein [Dehalococcoidia bacterium]
MSPVCIDASVALKWYLREEDSAAADQLLQRLTAERQRRIAPPHFRPEVLNVIYRRILTDRAVQRLSDDEAYRALHSFLALDFEVMESDALYDMAYQVCRAYGLRSGYDGLYVATARLAECELWTADQRLLRALDGRLSFVKALADFHPQT